MPQNMSPEKINQKVHASHKMRPIPYEVADMCDYCSGCKCHSDLTKECQGNGYYTISLKEYPTAPLTTKSRNSPVGE